MNPDLWKAYQIGLVVGLLILSTLILFPGRNDHKSEVSASTINKKTADTIGAATSPAATNDTESQPRQKSDDYGYWTPHRRLNAGVYVILIAAAAFFMVQSYSDADGKSKPSTLLDMLLRTYFPTEAAVLQGPKRNED